MTANDHTSQRRALEPWQVIARSNDHVLPRHATGLPDGYVSELIAFARER